MHACMHAWMDALMRGPGGPAVPGVEAAPIGKSGPDRGRGRDSLGIGADPAGESGPERGQDRADPSLEGALATVHACTRARARARACNACNA